MNNPVPEMRLRKYKKLSNIARRKVNEILGINIKRLSYKNLSDFDDMDYDDLYGYTIIDKDTKSVIILLHNIYKLELKEGQNIAERILVETIFHEARHLWQVYNIFNIYKLPTNDPNVNWLIENDAYQFTNMNLRIINEILNGNN